ncbi:MAG: Uma2 family endonuclease [Anaerolineaceae bacterium]|nr:Uma2 family endonuclease [Anaerolineaceae bacterium]
MDTNSLDWEIPDGTILAKYADITMEEFVALVGRHDYMLLRFNAAGDVVATISFNVEGIVRGLVATHICNWLFTGVLPGFGAATTCAFELEGWRCRPDVAVGRRVGNVIPREAPRMAVEIRSASNTWRELRAKAARYLQHGTQMVWLVDTDARSVEVHRVDTEVAVHAEREVIEGGDVLPGFQVMVGDLFPD